MLDRFRVPLPAIHCTEAELGCGLLWLASRPEQKKWVHFVKLDHLKAALELLVKAGNLTESASKTVLKERKITVQGSELPIVLEAADVAFYDDAVLAIYCDSKSLEKIERRLAPVGALCAVPWHDNDIAGWVTKHNPQMVNCSS